MPSSLNGHYADRVIENLGVGVLVVDEDLRVSMVNAELERLTGRKRGEIQGTTSWLDFIIFDESDWDDLKGKASYDGSSLIKACLMNRQGVEKNITIKISSIRGTGERIITVFDSSADRKGYEKSQEETEKSVGEKNLLHSMPAVGHFGFSNLTGNSPAMQQVYELILNAAAIDANVIIYGESGTGKELVARAIHEMSRRKSRSFVPVNCGAIPENLMESEFFGYYKGAFTGAVIDKHGFLDLANGGTLFMDELGEIGQNIQVKLLRAIDGGGFTPIGGSQVKSPDFRIIAATNRDLAEQVRKGLIREDFFYRIHVIPIHLPPLRDRKEDIPLLVDHFLEKFGKGRVLPPLTSRIMEALQSHDWPGNVRELQNTICCYLALKKLDFVRTVQQTPAKAQESHLPEPEEAPRNLESIIEHHEKRVIQKMLERYRWNRDLTSEALCIHRKTLFNKMKKFGLL